MYYSLCYSSAIVVACDKRPLDMGSESTSTHPAEVKQHLVIADSGEDRSMSWPVCCSRRWWRSNTLSRRSLSTKTCCSNSRKSVSRLLIFYLCFSFILLCSCFMLLCEWTKSFDCRWAQLQNWEQGTKHHSRMRWRNTTPNDEGLEINSFCSFIFVVNTMK